MMRAGERERERNRKRHIGMRKGKSLILFSNITDDIRGRRG
jgi:hypothetical protein